jgi:DNA-binding transcriptional LysR family regulator
VAIELRHLRYFVAAAEHRQLTRAAAQLDLTQPALSRALRSLEHDLGVALLRRHTRGVELTRAGRRFYPEARRALVAAREALEATRAAARPVRMSRLGFQAPWTAAATEVVNAAHDAHPGTLIRLVELDGPTVASDLWAGRVDAVLVWLPHDEGDLDYQPLAIDPIMACLTARHVLAHRETLRFSDVEDEPVPRPVPDRRVGPWYLDERRTRPPHFTVEAPRTLEGVAALVACGQAVCLGGRSLIDVLLRPGLVARPLVDVAPATLAMAWLRESRSRRLGDLLDAARTINPGSA